MILWPKVLYWTDKGLVSGWIGVWADWSAHFSYASVFAYRPPSEWLTSHPLYLGRSFTYPFLADMISGVFMRLNIDAVFAFVVPSVIATLLLITLLYFFYAHVLKSPKQAYVAMLIFLLGGGLGFHYFFKDMAEQGVLNTLFFPPKEYTHIGEKFIEWINVITGQLLPQRAFLLAIPITLILLFIVYRWWETKFSKVSNIHLIFMGLLSSLLLLVHVHSFIAFAILSGVFFLCDLRHWKKWLLFGITAAIPSVFIYLQLYSDAVSQGFFRWYPGWLANPRAKDLNFLYFWWINWGVFLPFSLFSIVFLRWYKKPLMLGGFLLFVLANLFLFQPYDWDNSKILTWTYLIWSIPVSRMLALLWKKHALLSGAAVVLFVSMTFSGGLDAWRLLHTDRLSHIMWTYEDLGIARAFREVSDPSDIVLVSDKHNHWVSTQTGRQVLLGYKGWMWTYGIDYTERDRDMRTMFAGGQNAEELMQKYGIDWVVIGPSELYDYNANEQYFSTYFPLVLQNNEYHVYKVVEIKRIGK